MFRILVCAVLVLSTAFLFGQQSQPQTQNPPPPNPQTSPDNQRPQQQPGSSSQDKASVNSQIQSNIKSALSGDPALSGADVQASVDDVNITLTGTVQSQGQLDRVLALISPYAQYRKVVN